MATSVLPWTTLQSSCCLITVEEYGAAISDSLIIDAAESFIVVILIAEQLLWQLLAGSDCACMRFKIRM